MNCFEESKNAVKESNNSINVRNTAHQYDLLDKFY
jgi:hypothetical protein